MDLGIDHAYTYYYFATLYLLEVVRNCVKNILYAYSSEKELRYDFNRFIRENQEINSILKCNSNCCAYFSEKDERHIFRVINCFEDVAGMEFKEVICRGYFDEQIRK